MAAWTTAELQALITLLADEDEATVEAARAQLVAARDEALPQLRRAAQSDDLRLRVRAREVLEAIREEQLKDQFNSYFARPDEDLELLQGAYLVAQVGHVDFEQHQYDVQLEHMEQQVREGLASSDSAHRLVEVINEVLFTAHQFRGDRERLHSPENFCLSRVFDRRCGNPLTLSVLYIVLARRLGVGADGIGMPGHFLVKLHGIDKYFIDPYNGGQRLTSEDCAAYLEEAGYGFHSSYLLPVNTRSIIVRLLSGLLHVQTELGNFSQTVLLTELLDTALPDR